MPHKHIYDIVVVGAGLAGLTLAHSLQAHHLKIAVIDIAAIGSSASGVPISLINPIAGKQAKLTWQTKACLRSIELRLEQLKSSTGLSFYIPSGILRPAMDEPTFEKFQLSYQKYFGSETWIHFLNESEMRAHIPDLHCVGGGFWLNKGGVVDTPAYLKALHMDILKKDIPVFDRQRSVEIQWSSGIWLINSPSLALTSKKMVITTGFRTKEIPFWNWLPVHTIKGQVLFFRSHRLIPWQYGISGEGYLGHINGYDWVIGSTYEHHFEKTTPDAEGLDLLKKKADLHFATLREHSSLLHHWASIRLGTPNRLPIIGEHPEMNNLYVFAGMGSKGLLYSSYLAELLADHIIDPGVSLPKDVSVKRFIYP